MRFSNLATILGTSACSEQAHFINQYDTTIYVRIEKSIRESEAQVREKVVNLCNDKWTAPMFIYNPYINNTSSFTYKLQVLFLTSML